MATTPAKKKPAVSKRPSKKSTAKRSTRSTSSRSKKAPGTIGSVAATPTHSVIVEYSEFDIQHTQTLKDLIILDPSDPFEAVVRDMVLMNREKRADYATANDVLKNFRDVAASVDLPGYTALEDIMTMVARKHRRINNLRGRDAQNESVQDSYMDLAVYAALAVVAAREA